MTTLSTQEARNIIIANHGFYENEFGVGKKAVLNVIEHLGYVQIDTISVVERAHHHTIWSRVSDYQQKYLDELIAKDKTVFEYWSHAAAYLPMRDYRFSLPRKNLYASGKLKWYFNKRATDFVYDRIKAEGALQSKDFEEAKKKQGWWEWKESKRALEQLFMEGKLMVAQRKGFQKVYDLTERILPAKSNTKLPTANEYAEYLINKTIRANGMTARSEIGHLRGYAQKNISETLLTLEEEQKIIQVKVEGVEKEIFYTTKEILKSVDAPKKKAVKILSPFDNCTIQRKRLKQIFNYDYTIECYVPEKKRVYGYFTLPVLYGNELIGRIDCKAERKEKVLVVKNNFLEKGFRETAQFKNEFGKALKLFTKFNGCETVRV